MANFNKNIANLIAREIDSIAEALGQEPSGANPWLLRLPDPADAELSPTELSSLVVRSSNNYARLARLAGMTAAHAKIAKGAYERKMKSITPQGSNADARQAYVFEQCVAEHEEMITADALANLCDTLMTGARVISESARKLYDRSVDNLTGERRSAHGALREADFSGY